MNREFIEKIKKLEEVLKKFNNDFKFNFVQETMNEVFNEDVEISIKKFKGSEAETCIKGTSLGILVTLAGLEKSILKQLNTSDDVWNSIKKIVGVKEADDNE